MKRFLLFIALAGLAPPAHAQFFVGPASPTPAVVSLGSGLSTALGNPVNASGGLPLLGGTVTAGDCLVWGANGIQDAGSGCAAGNVTGMGAPVGTSLSNRATDFGVTFNLKTDFGAKCDGATDDTAAIQNWLNKAAAKVRLVAPGGTCLFSAPLTIAPVNSLTITGAGAGATIFTYTGASTTSDLFTFGTGTGAAGTHVTLADFSIVSNTVMAGGYALHLHGLFDSVVSDVFADDVNSAAANAGRLCGGFWFDGAGGVDMIHPGAYSTQNCGDGVRVNSAQGGSAELRIVGGDIGGHVSGSGTAALSIGFANALHMAGGFGGLRCDETNFHNNGYGLLIDNAVTAAANREFDQGSTCAFDSNENGSVFVNDTLASGGTLDLAGWEASTQAGHGIVVQAWHAGDVEIRGDKVYNNCGSGVYVADATAHVLVSSATSINGNGTTLGGNTACTAWQAANPGHGYGIEASVATSNIWSTASPFGNSAGSYNANTNLSGVALLSGTAPFAAPQTVQGASGAQARFNVNQVGGGNSAILAFQENQTDEYTLGFNPSGNLFGLNDKTSGTAVSWLSLTAGNATLGEGPASTLSVNANFVADYLATFDCLTTVTAAAGAQARLNINQIGGGNGAVLGFQNGGTDEWTLGNNSTGNMFSINDKTTGAAVAWLALSAGGNATLGETTGNTLTVAGSLAAKSGAAPTASGSCSIGTQLGGQIAGSFKASAACSSGTVILTFAAAQANGYACDARDTTTPVDALNETKYSTKSATFTGSMASGDVVVWKCTGF